MLHYQHYRSFGEMLSGWYPVLLVYLAVQAVVVFLGLAARWFVIRSWFSAASSLAAHRNGLVFRSHLCCSLSQFPGFASELLFATFIQAVNLGNVVLFAWSMPEDALDAVARRLGRLFGNPAEVGDPQTGRLDRFGLARRRVGRGAGGRIERVFV